MRNELERLVGLSKEELTTITEKAMRDLNEKQENCYTEGSQVSEKFKVIKLLSY